MNNKLAQDFNLKSLLKFALPTTIMMIFMAMYQVIDGVFVSRFINEYALSAINIVYPVVSVIIALSIMLATGGSAIIAKNMGEGKNKEAKENFTFFVCVGFILGIIITIFGLIFMKEIITKLGSTELLFDYCYQYLFVLTLVVPFIIVQMLFQNFFVAASKPHLGLFLTILGGVLNIGLDYLFIVPFKMGMIGASLATAIGYTLPAIIGLLYFSFYREGSLYFVKPVIRMKTLLLGCSNGASEMVNNLAVAITTFIFNDLMLKYASENGVAAITIILYSQWLLTSIFVGFSTGISPIVSYNYGANNHTQLKKVFKNSVLFVITTSLIIFMIGEIFKDYIIVIFANKNSETFKIAHQGFSLFSISFLFTGINIFASALFTAFNNGVVSAILSFLRTFLFLIVSLYGLSYLFELNGVFLSVPVAEFLGLITSIFFIIKYRKIYHYN